MRTPPARMQPNLPSRPYQPDKSKKGEQRKIRYEEGKARLDLKKKQIEKMPQDDESATIQSLLALSLIINSRK